MQETEKIEHIIKDSLTPFLEQVRKLGLKVSIEKLFPGFYINDFVIKHVRKSLSLFRVIDLGRFAGKINVYYRNNSVYLDCIGTIGLFINQIIISDAKIINIISDIFNQVEEIFFKNQDNLIDKINKILRNLEKKEVFKASDFGEKSLYDFLIVVLFSYYSTTNLNFPEWFEVALEGLNHSRFAKDVVDFFVYASVRAFKSVSENVYVNYDMLVDSKILKFFLNKNTDKGKVASILDFLNIDLQKVLNGFVEKYASEAFLKGLGDHLVYMIQDLVMGVSEKPCGGFANNFNFTSCIGSTINSRKFRWFGNNHLDEYLELSKSKTFGGSFVVKAEKEKIMLYRPSSFNLGTIAKYHLESRIMYSVDVRNLEFNREYYVRIKRNSGDFQSKFIVRNSRIFKFIVMSDSQGMVKNDYDIFIKVLKSIYNNLPETQFVVHLGDFVDDGVDESYWDFLLNSDIWCKVPVFPISGNHEAKFHPTLKYVKNRNSILNHFNVEFLSQSHLDSGVYYSFEHNDCIYIFLNTNISGGLGKEQIKWANSVLSKTSAKWKILFSHKSPYSQGPHSGDTDVEFLRKEINELCLEFKIDIVFSGHDHVYSRSKPLCLGKITEESIKGNRIFNPSGTVFVSLGAVGVKSYIPQNFKDPKIDVLLLLDKPSFAHVIVEGDELRVQICEYSLASDFDLVDEFVIIKSEIGVSDPFKIDRSIENLPVIPWVRTDIRTGNILSAYNKLDSLQKMKVRYISKLNSVIKCNLVQKKISESSIAIVFNKEDFLSAIKNPKVGTIVVKNDVISFENKFGFGRKVKVEHDVLIKGFATLKFVTFDVRPNVNLYLGESLIIYNCRKKFSLYKSLTSFILRDNSNLVILDNVWIEQLYGRGYKNKNMILIYGENGRVFVNSRNFNVLPKNFVSKKFLTYVFNQV